MRLVWLLAVIGCSSKSAAPTPTATTTTATAAGSDTGGTTMSVTGSGTGATGGATPKPEVKLVGCKLAEAMPRPPKTAETEEETARAAADSIAAAFPDDGHGDDMGAKSGGGAGGGMGFATRTSTPPGSAAHVRIINVIADPADPTDGLKRTIIRSKARLEMCYQRRLVQAPSLKGRVILEFFVDTQGSPSPVTVSETPDAQLGTCMAQAVRALAYPKPEGTTTLKIPIDLQPPPSNNPKLPEPQKPPVQPPVKQQPHVPGPPPAPAIVTQWTPYATLPAGKDPHLADVVKATIENKLGALQLCASTEGTVRAMLTATPKGVIASARVGGLGDAKSETCIGAGLVQLEFPALGLDVKADTEVACDFTIGAGKPFRVTPSDQYATYIVTKSNVTKNGIEMATASAFRPEDPKPMVPTDRVMLVLADPDAPRALIERVVSWGDQAPQVLVALNDGTLFAFGSPMRSFCKSGFVAKAEVASQLAGCASP